MQVESWIVYIFFLRLIGDHFSASIIVCGAFFPCLLLAFIFCVMSNRITKLIGEECEYSIDNICTQENSVFFAYNDCVVTDAKNLGGYVALVGREWVYASPENYRTMLNTADHRESNMGIVQAVKISDKKLIEWLEQSPLTSFIEE